MIKSLNEAKAKNLNQSVLEYLLANKTSRAIINGSVEFAKFLCSPEADLRPFIDQYLEDLMDGSYVDVTMDDDEVQELYLLIMNGADVKGFIGDKEEDDGGEYLDKIKSKYKDYKVFKDEDNLSSYFVIMIKK